MNREQKRQILDCVETLQRAHEEIRLALSQKKYDTVGNMLSECQEFAVSIGESIEKIEGEGHMVVPYLEEYCEILYNVFEKIKGGNIDEVSINKKLRKKLSKIDNCIRYGIKVKKVAVFLPYKASMWDSLESVWKAAAADPECTAYVIPIPYYDKNPDGSFGKKHYEGYQYPEYVPITKYDKFDFETLRPDMIFIHNPYDDVNYITSVPPFFFSENLKKYTDCLVYIPYYATAGGMSQSRRLCPVYFHVDYIVIQSEKYRHFFDERIPNGKFLAFGSPKFDSVIHKCQNPPPIPEQWTEKIKEGTKVYFYNTSIGGVLENTTQVFLAKMRYVFNTFKGRKDACLLWRPHPLLESTIDSMRPFFKTQYEQLKREFIEDDIGIYDDTPDIESSIALSDAYIGKEGSSVVSLFGVAGKPIFALNNYIHELPGEDDWYGEMTSMLKLSSFNKQGDDRYIVSRNNQLWFSKNNDYQYRFYMDLGCEYYWENYYQGAVEIRGRIYVIPQIAQHLLIIEDKKIRRLDFEFQTVQWGAFSKYWYNEKYIFVFPQRYPFLIRFDIDSEEISYVNGISQFNVRPVGVDWWSGGVYGLYGNEIIFASPEENQFLFLDIDTLKARQLSSNAKSHMGVFEIVPDPYGDELWLLPMHGLTIVRWNPKTGETREYDNLPRGFRAIDWPSEMECREKPFANMAFSRESGREIIVISPHWGNMYLTLDRETGEMREWKPPINFALRGRNGYFLTTEAGGFVVTDQQRGRANCRLWNTSERKLYDINIDTKECSEVKMGFDYSEAREHEPGFAEKSEWLQYCINETAFNSLKDFLDGNITGIPFDRERQIRAFSKINASTDGNCGEKVYDYVKRKTQS